MSYRTRTAAWLAGVIICVLLILTGCGQQRGVSTPASDMGLSPAGFTPTQPFATTNYWYQQLAYFAPTHYLRTGASWDAFGTTNGGGCVMPTAYGAEAWILINDVYATEQAGQTPVVVLGPDIWGATAGYQWPAGAQLGAVPNDNAYACGVTELINALKTWGIYTPNIRLEVWNEPDNGTNIGAPVSPEQAAHYVGDAIYGGGRNFGLISGTFASPYNSAYISRYVNYLRTYGWGDGAWSFHDYNDVSYGADHGCDPNYQQGCTVAGAKLFLSELAQAGASTGNVWITETGDPAYAGWVTHSRYEEAHAGWNFEKLRWSGVAHLLWYQFQTVANDGWDSALANTGGQNRPSFCVMTYNEVPTWAVNDGRCTAPATPHKPQAHKPGPSRYVGGLGE